MEQADKPAITQSSYADRVGGPYRRAAAPVQSVAPAVEWEEAAPPPPTKVTLSSLAGVSKQSETVGSGKSGVESGGAWNASSKSTKVCALVNPIVIPNR